VTNEHERLLQFLYLCPVGVAEVNSAGKVLLLNAMGIQLLLPVAGPNGMDNLFEFLARHAPEVLAAVRAFDKPTGSVCDALQVELLGLEEQAFFSFTVCKVEQDSLLIAFTDVTGSVLEQRRTQEALEQEAVQKGKFELAAGVLHDVGNAVTGVGTRVARMLGECDWEESQQLKRLAGFVAQQRPALAGALGDVKVAALETFLSSLETALEQRRAEYCQNLEFLTRAVAHVQEVLNIQRIYVRQRPAGDSELRELLADAVMMQQGSLDKRQIHASVDCPRDLPPCSLDRTRFLQVLVNLIKNACESFDQCERQSGRELKFTVSQEPDLLTLRVTDNANGFAPELASELFDRGRTSKSHGWGYGLANCRQILSAHGGAMTISSPGPGLGASVVLTLPIRKEASLCSAP